MSEAIQQDCNEWDNALAAERIGGLDLLRGLALLGILLANVHQMFMPWDIANEPVQFTGSNTSTLIDWFLIEVLVNSKFLTVFSLLFGIGFGLQVSSLKARQNGQYKITYLRRIFMLAIFGVFHGLHLYGADVLLYYAVTGFVLLWLCEWRAKTLMLSGLGLTLMVLLLSFVLSWGASKSPLLLLAGILLIGLTVWLSRNAATPQILVRSLASFLVAVIAYGAVTVPDVSDGQRWHNLRMDAETAWQTATANKTTVTLGDSPVDLPLSTGSVELLLEADLAHADHMALAVIAYQDGPASLVQALRTNQFIQAQVGFALYFFWRTLAIFMIGLGLVKWGLFRRLEKNSYRQAARWGLMTGLPLALLGAALDALAATTPGQLPGVSFLIHEASVYPLSLALAAAVMLWAQSKAWQRIQQVVSSAGRMALTNYLAQSAVMLWLASGLGLYGSLTRMEQSLLACGVFAGIALLSHLWLVRFRMGPVERLWRVTTYGWKIGYTNKRPPLA